METFDVAVIGAGPGGSSCAWRLRQSGLRTVLIDKKAFPRNKPCAGWITPQVVETLQLDVEDYRRGRTWQPITGFRCGIIGRDDLAVRYGSIVSYGIRRYEFDDYLRERAGGEQRLNEPVDKL